MANKKKKAEPNGGMFTLGRTMEERAAATSPEKKSKKREPKPTASKSRVWICVLAVLALAGIGVGIFFGFFYDGSFSYLTSDLSKYITVKESDYSNIVFDIPLVSYEDEDVERALASYLVDNRGKAKYDGLGIKELPIELGSTVSYFYRRYTIDENGREVDIPENINIASDTAATLTVGDYDNFKGIDALLMGKIPSQLTPLEKIISGKVEEGDVIYVSYSAVSPLFDKSVVSERIDLSDPEIEKTYGTGFIDYVVGLDIGSTQSVFYLPQGDKGDEIAYASLTVDFVTRCEDGALTLETEFSPTYSDDSSTGSVDESTLRGTRIYMDIFVKHHVMYELPEYNDEFITETLGIERATLDKYEGATLAEKHARYTEELIKDNIESVNNRLIEEKLLAHFKKIGEVVKYPEAELDTLYNSYLVSLQASFEEYGSSYESFDDFACYAYGLSDGADWEEYLMNYAKSEIKNTMVFFYVARTVGYLPPTEEEYNEVYDRIMSYELDLLIEEHRDEIAELEGEEYDEYVAELREEIIDTVGESGLKAVIWREIATDKMVKRLVSVPQRK